jgi:hypothetical protein
MLHFLKTTIFIIFGSLLLLGGLFLTAGGAVSGFGHSQIIYKVAFASAGVVVCGISIYLLYLGSNRKLSSVIIGVIGGIFLP